MHIARPNLTLGKKAVVSDLDSRRFMLTDLKRTIDDCFITNLQRAVIGHKDAQVHIYLSDADYFNVAVIATDN